MNLTHVLPENPFLTLMHEGFLFVRLPPGLQKSVQATFDAGYSFFHEPLSAKTQFIFEQDMGYRPFGGEYSVSPDFPDQLESFSISPRLAIPFSRLHMVTARTLYARMSHTFDLFEPIVEGLITLLANQVSDGRVNDSLNGKLRSWSRLQLNYTQPALVSLPFINESHDDLDLMTFTCAPRAGLEIKVGENHFIPVTTAPEEALVFPGEIAWLLSGGKLSALYHRVRTHPLISERISLLLFVDPEPPVCKPWITNSVNRGVDISERVRRNVSRFGLTGFTEGISQRLPSDDG
ncbi:MAG TPA: 2OG-Fe(II) oxygenase family protein [Pyrinomonadaceae bacterium]|nr:2OG-Fe(II) oxygenase family protein [Pyrinomonadaceae bacterium]